MFPIQNRRVKVKVFIGPQKLLSFKSKSDDFTIAKIEEIARSNLPKWVNKAQKPARVHQNGRIVELIFLGDENHQRKPCVKNKVFGFTPKLVCPLSMNREL